MTDDEYQPVAVPRRICAPAHDIFQVLANPVRHPEFDGSQSLRGAGSTAVISDVGDVFVMKMYFSHLGDYEMNNHVVEYEQNRRIGWEPEAGRGHPRAGRSLGQRWSYQLTPDGPDATVVTEITTAHERRKRRVPGWTTARSGSKPCPRHWSCLTRCAPGKDTSPVRRRVGWPGSAVMGPSLDPSSVAPLDP